MLSIVLPMFEPPLDVDESLDALRAELETAFGSVELVVVDDGSRIRPVPDTVAAIPRVRLLRFPRNRGKGEAIRRGMTVATGSYKLFMDGDLPYDLDSIVRVVEALADGSDIAIGDRTLEESNAVEIVRGHRALLSRLVSVLFAHSLSGGLPDTQCGLKGFRADVADRLFPVSRCRRYLIDLELLQSAHHSGFDIARVSVHQNRFEPSTIRIWKELLPTLLDLSILLARAWSGRLRIHKIDDRGPAGESGDSARRPGVAARELNHRV